MLSVRLRQPGARTANRSDHTRALRGFFHIAVVERATAYPRTVDFERFKEIADETGAVLVADIAHIAGLIAGGVHPSPIPYADIVTTTTHKTLRGPRGAMIMCKEEYRRKIDSAVFPRMQGGPMMHVIAAKAVAFKEALQPEFKMLSKARTRRPVDRVTSSALRRSWTANTSRYLALKS